jgi:hypothetical protein
MGEKKEGKRRKRAPHFLLLPRAMTEEHFDYLFKVVLVGDSGVGKVSPFISRSLSFPKAKKQNTHTNARAPSCHFSLLPHPPTHTHADKPSITVCVEPV